MGVIPEKIFRELVKNVYDGINLSKIAIVILWTLLGLFFINKRTSHMYAVLFGLLFYISLLILCLVLFKDIKRYLSFPKDSRILPRFIGYKQDIIFVYPILLMSVIGAINNLLIASGLFPKVIQNMNVTPIEPIEFVARISLLPFVAVSEELLNLIIVSLYYNRMKFLGSIRLPVSIFIASLTFGIMHSVGWGLNTGILIGLSYMPVFFITLYTGNVWISLLAHFYNDFISVSKSYYGSFHFIIIASLCLMPFIWAIRTMVRKTD
ncbi:MAG: hypothetical protein PHC45_09330 [Clostridiaceae bacterium]|nr:hypothetical protein [Clostridiaceae bacterium]